MEHLLDLKETAAIFSASKKTVRQWYARGDFPKPIRLGGAGGKLLRWRSSELTAYIANGCLPVSTTGELSDDN